MERAYPSLPHLQHIDPDLDPSAILRAAFPRVFVINADAHVPGIAVHSIMVDRNDMIRSSFHQVMCPYLTRNLQRGIAIDVAMDGESGYGAGVVRDWLTELGACVFGPELGLFQAVPGVPNTVHPVLTSSMGKYGSVAASNEWFEFAGRVAGLAIRLNAPTAVHLSSAAWRAVLGQSPRTEDLKQLQPHVYRSCLTVMQASAEELRSMALNFEVGAQPLMPSSTATSASREVTSANRRLYLSLMIDHYCGVQMPGTYSIGNLCLHRAMSMFASGLLAVSTLPSGSHMGDIMRGVTAQAFNAASGGAVSSLGVDDLRCVTQVILHEPTQVATRTVDAFWEMLRDTMTDDQRRSVLRFWTGSRALPQVADVPFSPTPASDGTPSDDGTTGATATSGCSSDLRSTSSQHMLLQLRTSHAPHVMLPTASTCMRQLILPTGCSGDVRGMFRAFAIALEHTNIEDDHVDEESWDGEMSD